MTPSVPRTAPESGMARGSLLLATSGCVGIGLLLFVASLGNSEASERGREAPTPTAGKGTAAAHSLLSGARPGIESETAGVALAGVPAGSAGDPLVSQTLSLTSPESDQSPLAATEVSGSPGAPTTSAGPGATGASGVAGAPAFPGAAPGVEPLTVTKGGHWEKLTQQELRAQARSRKSEGADGATPRKPRDPTRSQEGTREKQRTGGAVAPGHGGPARPGKGPPKGTRKKRDASKPLEPGG